MTREEAYQEFSEWYNLGFGHSTMPGSEVLAMAMKSLHPITREQVEKMRSEWKHRFTTDDSVFCTSCKTTFRAYYDEYNFCPDCGAPMTYEAVDILWNRLEAMQDEQAD